jgi:hypothetical protein
VARPEEDDEEEEEREREEGLPVMAHGASGDCGSGNGDASGGWGHGGARCWLLFLLFPPLFFSVFFSLFFIFSPFLSVFLFFFLSVSRLSFSLVLHPSVFIGKTEGRERLGRPLCSRPKNR